MNDKLERLRYLWKYAPAEERHAISVTGKALIEGIDPQAVDRRIAAHERRFAKKNYSV
jgi:hypothetical protein